MPVRVKTDAEDLVAMLNTMGFQAYDDYGPSPSVAHVCVNGTDDYPAVLLAVDFNRDDHGWEAVLDTGGDQESLEDGPGPDALADEVARWAAKLAADPAAHRA